MNDFGTELRRIRKEKKLSIRKLGELSGISHAYLSQIENKKREAPKPELIRKLAEGLQVNIIYLMLLAGHIDISDYKNGIDFNELTEDELDELADLQQQANEKIEMEPHFLSTFLKTTNLNFILNELEDDVYYKERLLTSKEREKINKFIKEFILEDE